MHPLDALRPNRGLAAQAPLLLVLLAWAVLSLGQQAAAQETAAAADQPPASAAGTQTLIPQERSLLEVIRSGGVLMVPILACSVLTLVFVLERLVSLRRGNVIPRPFVKRFLLQLEQGQLDPEQALELCQQNRSPVAELFAAAVRKWGRPSVEVEQALIDAGERITNHLRKYLRVLNAVATVCPLLGLLGTVMGMIEAFQSIATNMALGRPELLAEGISKALVTTAAGLSVAIPALIAYLYFVSRVDRLVMEMDALGQEVVELVAGDAPRQPARSTAKRKARAA